MQPSSICLSSSPNFLPLQSTKISKMLVFPTTKPPQFIQTSTSISIKAAAASSDTPEVDYSSMASSVFPAEACETVGGVACDVEMFPETKLRLREEPPKAAKVGPGPGPGPTSETVDREYLEYNSPKTVFIAEACDDLGGEFCDPEWN